MKSTFFGQSSSYMGSLVALSMGLGLFMTQSAQAEDIVKIRTWKDLEVQKSYQINRNLVLDVESRTANGQVSVAKGQSIQLVEIMPLDELNIQYFHFTVPNCTFPTLSTTILIVNPEAGKSDDPSVGVKIEPGCELGIFVEDKDLSKKSLF